MWLHIALTLTQEMEERAVPTGAAIQETARAYAKEVDPGTTFQASAGWFWKFLQREGLVAGEGPHIPRGPASYVPAAAKSQVEGVVTSQASKGFERSFTESRDQPSTRKRKHTLAAQVRYVEGSMYLLVHFGHLLTRSNPEFSQQTVCCFYFCWKKLP